MANNAAGGRSPAIRVVLFSENEILFEGLKLVGFPAERQARCGRKTNLRRFKRMFGSHPAVYVAVWKDLQLIKKEEHRLVVGKNPLVTLKDFFLTIYFLKKYPTGEHLFADKLQRLRVDSPDLFDRD